jgi:hypothetical protein
MVLIPTTKQIKETNLTNLESRLNQDSPLNDKAFLKVLAVVEAIIQTGQYKYAAERIRQNLILSATGDDLKRLGNELEVIYKDATQAELQAEITGGEGKIIPLGTSFKGELNGIQYVTTQDSTISGGTATLYLIAQTAGTVGNLNNGSELIIQVEIPDVDSIATVTDTDIFGIDDENEEVYRERVLFAYRAVRGAGTAADYKAWSEIVVGVKRVYPFAGKPLDPPGSCPGDRTVFVEATETVDPDGIAPPALLDQVRDAINTDSAGKEQVPLGLEDSLLYVESIIRNEFFVKIIGLVVDAGQEAALKSDISDALGNYFRNEVRPYVTGLDSVFQKNDVITQNFVSAVVEDPLKLYSASCSEVQFSKTDGVPTPILTYTLADNELAKLGTVTYV